MGRQEIACRRRFHLSMSEAGSIWYVSGQLPNVTAFPRPGAAETQSHRPVEKETEKRKQISGLNLIFKKPDAVTPVSRRRV